jgi:hypothetical protein
MQGAAFLSISSDIEDDILDEEIKHAVKARSELTDSLIQAGLQTEGALSPLSEDETNRELQRLSNEVRTLDVL